MKKHKKLLYKSIIVLIAIIALFLLSIYVLFLPKTWKIKTEYGDSFTVTGGGAIEEYVIQDDNGFYAVIEEFHGKKGFQSICDTPYFRCYQVQGESDNLYIINIKSVGSFFSIYISDIDYTKQEFTGKRGSLIKANYLCDVHLMQITGAILFELYHDEMMTMRQDLINGNYGDLKKYGLTSEMTDETEIAKRIEVINQFI